MRIDGITIPSAYTLIESGAENHPITDLRYFAGEHGKTHGPFVFDPNNSAYQEFLLKCKIQENTLGRELEKAVRDERLPFYANRRQKIDRLIREGRRQLLVLIKPPHFKTDPQISREQRFAPPRGTTTFCLHIDEQSALHFMRRWEHRSDPYPLRNQLQNIFAQEVCLRVRDEKEELRQKFLENNIQQVACLITGALRRAFDATTIISHACPDWYQVSNINTRP